MALSKVININDEIKQLEDLGLKITDREKFRYYVKNFNVNTFVTEYSDFFVDEYGKYHDTESEEIIALYNFDKNLGNHIVRDILIIEKIINTNVAYATINEFNIKDKCLFKFDRQYLRQAVLTNIGEIDPPISFEIFLRKMTKFLEANKICRKYIDYRSEDEIYKWRNLPLDIMCLSWSFATAFSFFIATTDNVRREVLDNFGIPFDYIIGFMDFIKNAIHVRNLISHNIVIFNAPVKYHTIEFHAFYELFIGEKHEGEFKLIHLIKLFAHFSGDESIYKKTVGFARALPIKEPHKSKIESLFDESFISENQNH